MTIKSIDGNHRPHGRRTRRQFLGDTAKLAAAGTLAGGFPHIARGSEGIRTIGLAVSIINEIQGKASEDLGFAVRGQALGYGAMVGKMLNQNDQYEVAEGYFNDMDVMIPSKVWQPIDTQRIPEWEKVSDLTKTGRLTPGVQSRQGDAPFRHLWLDEDGNRVEGPSRYISMLPGWHNADSLGYNPEETGRPIESWAELFSDEFAGQVALLNAPQIGVMDAALAVEGLGIFQFKDKGNMTREEIDFLIDFLIEKKQAGHFRAFWETFGQSVNLMVNGEVVLESMWSPAVTAIKAEGVPCVYAFPKEGMRGWHGGCAISARATGKALDQPTSTSTGGSKAGAVRSSPGRATTCRCPRTSGSTSSPRSGTSGTRASRPPRSCRIPTAPSSSKRARSATAGRTGTGSATSRCGTLSWTRTTTSWSAGRSS